MSEGSRWADVGFTHCQRFRRTPLPILMPMHPDDALLLAMENEDVTGIEAAIRAGADPNAAPIVQGRLISGYPTWLAWLAWWGRTPLVLALLDAGAAPCWTVSPRADRMAQGCLTPGVVTPLHVALDAHRRALSLALLRHPSLNVHAQDADGWTVLHMAAWHNAGYAMPALLRSGANPLLPDLDGATPIALARQAGHGALAQRLEAPLLRAVMPPRRAGGEHRHDPHRDATAVELHASHRTNGLACTIEGGEKATEGVDGHSSAVATVAGHGGGRSPHHHAGGRRTLRVRL